MSNDLDLAMTFTIGCFEVRLLNPGRWQVKNLLTTFEHVTYGTEQEVCELLTKQTKDWERRYSTKKGTPWRETNRSPIVPKAKVVR